MTKTRWRIYTEYVHTRHIAKIVSKYFADYSMFSGIRHHGDDQERCLVIEINCDANTSKEMNIEAICQEINTVNHQMCCLVTAEQVDVMTIPEKNPS